MQNFYPFYVKQFWRGFAKVSGIRSVSFIISWKRKVAAYN